MTRPASATPPRPAMQPATATPIATPTATPAARVLSGRAVLMMMVAGFGVIIGANLVLAVNAVRSFPGLETDNSYIASQTFDRDRAAQEALGWDVDARIDGDLLRLSFDGPLGASHGDPDAQGRALPVAARRAGVAKVSGTLGRPTHLAQDRVMEFYRDGTLWVARIPALDDQGPLLGAGNWNLRLTARADDGTEFRQRIPLLVKAVR